MNDAPLEWKSTDGKTLRGWYRGCNQEPKGVICLVHGLGEHSRRYGELAERFVASGYAFIAFDLRGHGESEGQAGHTPSYEQLLDDLEGFLDQVARRFPKIDRILYGHSFGGSLVLNLLLRRDLGLTRAIVCSPLLATTFKPPGWKLWALEAFERVSPRLSLSTGVKADGVSRDLDFVLDFKEDPKVHDRVSIKMGAEMFAAGAYAVEHAGELKQRVLLMHGDADPITCAITSRRFAERAGERCTLVLWPGLYHELHHETEREEVFARQLAWLAE